MTEEIEGIIQNRATTTIKSSERSNSHTPEDKRQQQLQQKNRRRRIEEIKTNTNGTEEKKVYIYIKIACYRDSVEPMAYVQGRGGECE